MKKTSDLTEGKTGRVFLNFFFPMLFTNLLQQLYTFVDITIVGKGLGDNALAAVGNISVLTLLIIGFSQGVTNGFSVIIAQNFGNGNISTLRRSIAESIKLSVILSIILTGFSLIFLKNILLIMQTDFSIFNDSLIYGFVILGGLIITMGYNLCSGILRSFGDSQTPFLAIMVSSVLNILLDVLFIFILKAGVGSVAVATIISQAVSTVICVIRLLRAEGMQLNREDFKGDFILTSVLLKNGIPAACMNSVTAVGCMIVQSYINTLGVVYTSAYSVCNKYINFFMLPSVTAGFAICAFTSQNFGAEKYDRIEQGIRIGVMIGIISYLICGGIMVIIPDVLAMIMLNGHRTIQLTADFLRICGSLFFTLNFLFIYRSAVQGMGKPFIPMLSGFLEMALRIFVIVFFLPGIGFPAAAYAEVIAWIGALIINMTVYKYMMSDRYKIEK
ncbi:MAG: MATE family efflux transporter [Lachnospiraceae bacterium]|nr:MATE family efflux transporter [Lachnospiraceae bacterium]